MAVEREIALKCGSLPRDAGDLALAGLSITFPCYQLFYITEKSDSRMLNTWKLFWYFNCYLFVGLYRISAPAPAGIRHFFQIRQKSGSGKKPTGAG